MVYMNYQFLLETETETAAQFAEAFPELVKTWPELLDTLFQLGYFTDHPSPPPEDGVHHFCFERYLLAPYRFNALYSLCSRGYYLESVLIVRHLLETLVQIRHFQKHPDQLKPHLTSMTSAGRVQFKTMFEELSPGYYAKHYGQLLSNIAHGGIGMGVFSEYEQPKEEGSTAVMVPPLGCQFAQRASGFIVNHLLVLLYGHLKCFATTFPEYLKLVDQPTEERRQLGIKALSEWREGHKAAFPRAVEWHEMSELLFC